MIPFSSRRILFSILGNCAFDVGSIGHSSHRIFSVDYFFLWPYVFIMLVSWGQFSWTITPALAPLTSTSSSDPYATPILILTTIYHSATAFYGYARYSRTHQSAFVLGAIGSGILTAMGLWCILFGSSSHISRRTGADKRTSGWPFGNKEADRKRVPKKVR